jgi:Protein of unknown function (DUF1616)
MRRDLDLAVTALAALACAAWTGVPGLRIATGLLLVLVLPGYALSTLLVPGGPDRAGGPGRPGGPGGPVLWRAMWTAGLSLAVAVLGGLLLNLIPAGLTRLSWTLSSTGVTVLVAMASAWRRRRSRSELPHASRLPRLPCLPRWTPVTRLVACYALAAGAIAAGAVGLAVASAGWQHSPGFAQLWLVPSRGVATGGQATLGVRSGYAAAQTFHVVLRNGAKAISTWDFSLGTGQSWQRTITAAAGERLTAQLTTGQQATAQTVTITSS